MESIHRESGSGKGEKAKMEVNDLTNEIIGAAMEVHSFLGPGLLEGAYETCLCHELRLRSIEFERQKALPIVYKGVELDFGHRVDLLVSDVVVVEIEAVDELQPVHEAQVLTNLKLGGWNVGLLINFNAKILKSGVRRFDLGSKE